MVPTHVFGLNREVGWPALWSMRKLPPLKTAWSMVLPGCSAPPSLNAPVTMMTPGPAGLVDATWKYSAHLEDAGAGPAHMPLGPAHMPLGPAHMPLGPARQRPGAPHGAPGLAQ